MKAAAAPLTLILFLKMQADIYRYMAEQTQKYKDDVNYFKILPMTVLLEKAQKYGEMSDIDFENEETEFLGLKVFDEND